MMGKVQGSVDSLLRKQRSFEKVKGITPAPVMNSDYSESVLMPSAGEI